MANKIDMNFGEALELLKQGCYVARRGWNGKNMYLWLLPEINLNRSWVKDPKLLREFGEKETLFCNGSIRIKCANGSITTGWVPSQTDMLAEDWIEVDLDKSKNDLGIYVNELSSRNQEFIASSLKDNFKPEETFKVPVYINIHYNGCMPISELTKVRESIVDIFKYIYGDGLWGWVDGGIDKVNNKVATLRLILFNTNQGTQESHINESINITINE